MLCLEPLVLHIHLKIHQEKLQFWERDISLEVKIAAIFWH